MCPKKVSRGGKKKSWSGTQNVGFQSLLHSSLTMSPRQIFPSLTYSSSVKPSESQQHSSTSISLPPWLIVFLHPLGDPNIVLPPLFPIPLRQSQVLMGACGRRVGEEISESSAQLRTLGSFLATFSKAHNLSLIT